MKQPSVGINGKADRWISRRFAHDMRINEIKEPLIKGSLYYNEQGRVDTVTLFFPNLSKCHLQSLFFTSNRDFERSWCSQVYKTSKIHES